MRDLPFDDGALALGTDHAAEMHQLQRGQDRRQRISQLVTEHREELVLRAVGVSASRRAFASSVTSKHTTAIPPTRPSSYSGWSPKSRTSLLARAAAIEQHATERPITAAPPVHAIERFVQSLTGKLRQPLSNRLSSTARVPTIAAYA